MFRAIVPLLFSLLPSRPALGTDLLVQVADQNGKPVAGVQVALLGQAVFEGFHPPPMVHATATSDAQGIARFTDADKQVTPAEHMRFLVRLGVPAASDVEAEIDPKKLSEAAPRLTLPECGSVVLRLPIEGKARANLRRASGSADAGDETQIRFGDEPPTVKASGGIAHFEHVGLGIELAYEVTSRDLPAPLSGRFRGPTSKGQVVEFRVPGLEALPGLLVTLVDENLAPVHGVDVSYNITVSTTTSSGSSSSSRGGTLRPDEKGSARIPLVPEQARPGVRVLTLYLPGAPGAKERSYDSPLEIDLPNDFASGELDLGRILLAPAGSPRRFLLFDDAALEKRYEALLERIRKDNSSRREALEQLLAEMVRRGGARWQSYVAAKLEELRAPESEELRWRGPGDVELLTALRRLQGKTDPLALVLQDTSLLDATFPDSPTADLLLQNVDSAGESIAVTNGGSYRSGRFARCSVEAYGPDGKRLAPREWHAAMGGGMSSERKMAPGESMDFALPLGDYVEFARTGEFRVRIHYHDNDDIDSATNLGGRILSSSPEFRVHVLPRKLELAQARLEGLRGLVRAIDTKKPVLLVSGHWHEGMGFQGEATQPEDKLFRAGWEAVPALKAALEDKATEPERRAWVFGMLWNILGLENPGTHEHLAAMGTIRWSAKWPSSTEEARSNFGEFGEPQPVGIDTAKQDELTRVWFHRLTLFDVKIVP